MTRLAQASDRIPSTIFITGVTLQDRDRINGGAYGDIYKGELNGEAVALKRIRIFDLQSAEERTKLSKVGGLVPY